jgi:adenosine deaminase
MMQSLHLRARIAIVLSLAAATTPLAAQTPGEARTAHALEAARKLGPPELYAFLKPMPKGADLHMHLSGAVYAETFLAEAVQQNLCIDPVALKLTTPAAPTCPKGNVPASTVLTDQHLYDALIDSFSMRSFVPSAGISGHDQFFATFDRFRPLTDPGAWLDEVATRAAAQNEQYLEIMQTPPFGTAIGLAKKIGWPAGAEKNITHDQLAKLRDEYLASGLRDDVPVDIKTFADAKADWSAREQNDCVKQKHDLLTGALSSVDLKLPTLVVPPCTINIHWLYQILRANSPAQVFAQTLLGFEVASADPDVVGINFVQPEDARLAMADYHLQMQMLDYLHSVYPKVHISLHAGELAPGLVPPAGLSFHIREAIDLGHAERIGHGVDVLYEDRPTELLKEMADQHIMVEINLTSNDVILGVKDKDHPLAAYMAAHVPWALSTDDEGVSRIDLTHEYVRAVTDQNLTYLDLKRSARTSLEHAFLHGESLWVKPDDFVARKPVCGGPITAQRVNVSEACKAYLIDNEKAAAEYELEYRFALFEASIRSPALK